MGLLRSFRDVFALATPAKPRVRTMRQIMRDAGGIISIGKLMKNHAA